MSYGESRCEANIVDQGHYCKFDPEADPIIIKARRTKPCSSKIIAPKFTRRLLPVVFLGRRQWIPCSVVVQHDLVVVRGQTLALQDLGEVSVDEEVVVESSFVADGAEPLGPPLVHHHVEVGVEALEVVTRVRPARVGHAHLACRRKKN